ncbi:MAG: hypothetical protein H3C43_10555 [Leptonema sp. (in: Bacteria)]|nr:hypothetical protein [Leptonema sp. (in: bacteria)]
MRKLGFLTIVIALFFAHTAEAVNYKLFVHGRSGKSHCQTISNVNSATTDYNNYWGGAVTGLANVRYIGFDGTKSGGAYSWAACGAQAQLHQAIQTFCKGANSCEIYTHSTGGLVAAAYFGLNNPGAVNVTRIQLLANASGGSELADISTAYLSWLGIKSLGGELDQSVSTRGARNGFNHNNSGGRTLYTTSGEGSDYWNLTSPLLPGKDDGVLANHSLCNINRVAAVDVSCTRGNGKMRESYKCGFLWLKTCYYDYYRWTPYYTVYQGGSGHSHRDANKDYNRR